MDFDIILSAIWWAFAEWIILVRLKKKKKTGTKTKQ